MLTLHYNYFVQYARKLAEYIEEECINDLTVWTSELKRTKQTAEFIHAPQVNWKALNEINAVSYPIFVNKEVCPNFFLRAPG